MGLSTPVSAATSPEVYGAEVEVSPSALQAVDAFYAGRGGAPLWLQTSQGSSSERELLAVLERASIDGFDNGPELAAQAEALIARAQNRRSLSARAAADRLLSDRMGQLRPDFAATAFWNDLRRSVGQAAPRQPGPNPRARRSRT